MDGDPDKKTSQDCKQPEPASRPGGLRQYCRWFSLHKPLLISFITLFPRDIERAKLEGLRLYLRHSARLFKVDGLVKARPAAEPSTAGTEYTAVGTDCFTFLVNRTAPVRPLGRLCLGLLLHIKVG